MHLYVHARFVKWFFFCLDENTNNFNIKNQKYFANRKQIYAIMQMLLVGMEIVCFNIKII